MGLAQLLERPRNWQSPRDALNSTVSVTQDGQFFHMGTGTVSTAESARLQMLPFDIVVHRFFVKLRGNSLDGASVNTATLRVNRATTAHVVTITDASVIDTLLEVTGFTQAIAAGVEIGWIWNSDSTGTCILSEVGFSYRLVNPRA